MHICFTIVHGYLIIIVVYVENFTTNLTRQSEMANTSPCHMPVLGNVHTIKKKRDLSQFHMGGPNFDTGRSWKL